MNSFINLGILEYLKRNTSTISPLCTRKMETINFNNIEFTRIKDFDDYYISKCGKIYSEKRNIILKQQVIGGGKGYFRVVLWKNNKEFPKYVHRLLGLQFILNLNNYSQINHIDGDYKNNNLDNLEWCNQSYNCTHAYKILNRKPPLLGKFGKDNPLSKKVNQYTIEGEFIKTWNNAREINLTLNFSSSNIRSCCRKKYKQANGFIWRYC